MKEELKQRGKYVSRAAFAKLQAEKQRLFKDIELMSGFSAESLKVRIKWIEYFKRRNEFNNAIREMINSGRNKEDKK